MSDTTIFDIQLSKSDRERFARFLQRDEKTGCLIFTGSIHQKSRYGRFRIGGKYGVVIEAHKVAWVYYGNKITRERPCILHNCPSGDNRACCEETHLWSGTAADNALDMAMKGRGTKSSTGLPYGVHKKGGRYVSLVRINGRLVTIGTFDSWAIASALAFFEKNKNICKWLERLNKESSLCQ